MKQGAATSSILWCVPPALRPGRDACVVQTYCEPARDQRSLGTDGHRSGA